MSSNFSKEFILDPAHLADYPPDQILEGAARGYVALDHRFLHAMLDRPDSGIPAAVNFAARDRENDLVDLDTVLLEIFRYWRTTAALPFVMTLVRRERLNIEDDLVEAVVQFGAAAVDPLLELLSQLEAEGLDPGDVPFLLSQMRVRDPRILEALTRRLAGADSDAALILEMYGDPAAIPALEATLARLDPESVDAKRVRNFIRLLSSREPAVEEQEEPFDIWDGYPERDSPPLHELSEDERLAMLDSTSSDLKCDVALFYRNSSFTQQVRARLLELARTDPDATVRGECWESLSEIANEPETRSEMLRVLSSPDSSLEEKSGVAVALAQQTDNAVVFRAILALYDEPRARAKALSAMGQSFDRRFAEFPPRHLDDPDPNIKRPAIWGTGYLNLSSEAARLKAFFDDEEFRSDALFAYALCVPGDTSRAQARSLLKKMDDVAGGLRPDEEALIQVAIDQRLMLHGKDPVFAEDSDDDPDEASEAPAAAPSKVGRNDPCPCGSGKKYKKCCGA